MVTLVKLYSSSTRSADNLIAWHLYARVIANHELLTCALVSFGISYPVTKPSLATRTSGVWVELAAGEHAKRAVGGLCMLRRMVDE